MKKYLLSFVIIVSIISCQVKTKYKDGNEIKSIEETDLNFSKMSQEKGMKAAFLNYIDSNGVLLRPNNYPIIGSAAMQYLEKINDSSFMLTWAPSKAEVAESGDMGYSFGIYTLKLKDTTEQGTYVSIWKKQKDGRWKFILDTGNPGVDQKK